MHSNVSWELKSDNMGILIKPVDSEAEISTVADLAKTIWNEHYVPIIGQAQIDYMLDKYQSREAISTQIREEKTEYYLLHTALVPISYFSIIEKPGELFLSKLYVLASARGKGFGRITINFLLSRCRAKNLEYMTLTVNKNNHIAIKAYEKLGFEKYGEVVTDIGSGYVMDDYMMRLTVEPYS
jgi:ribosomal protein S18 acetylase RimI-like enzyme